MNKEYEQINFSVFSALPEIPVSPEEKQRLLSLFDQRVSAEACRKVKGGGRKGRQAWAMVAACLALIVCLTVTPLGDKTWAAVKQAFMGIGQFLGVSRQDDYATVIDQTQTRNGVTVTLCEAIASDHELQVSFRAVKDGKNMGDSKVSLMEYSINGDGWRDGLKTTGTGPFGTNLPESQLDRSMHYWTASFENYEMPLNPTIYVKLWAAEEEFDFTFVLENERFKADTKHVAIDRTITFRGKPIILKELIISPIDQAIAFENPEGVREEDLWRLCLYGTDQDGDPVHFYTAFGSDFYGSRANSDRTTYMLDPEVKCYTLRARDEELPDGEEDISDEFTIEVK